MMTWLDWLCRQFAKTEPRRDADPRRDFALVIGQTIYDATKHGERQPNGMVDEIWYVSLFSFLAEYLPPDHQAGLSDGSPMPKPLGIILTRPTANLLSNARSMVSGDVHCREMLGRQRGVYVDVPPGAILTPASMDGSDMLQLRAILGISSGPVTGGIDFVAVLTRPGSERMRGRLAGTILPTGEVKAVASASRPTLTSDPGLKAPNVAPFAESLARSRAAEFLRLVLSYYFFGPQSAREGVRSTAAERLRNGMPRKDESLFSMVRLNATPDRMGRPESTIPAKRWELTSQQDVAGHFKLQPYGPNSLLRKMIWVDPYNRGPEDAPVKPRAVVL